MEHGQTEDLNDLMRRRREEYNELLAHGVQPFAYEYPVDAEAAEVLATFTDEAPQRTVAIAGRIMTMRRMGKASFAHIMDHTGKIQIYAKRDDLGEEIFATPALSDGKIFVRTAKHLYSFGE